LYKCPVASESEYRQTVFAMFPSIKILDGYNLEGDEDSIGSEESEGYVEEEEEKALSSDSGAEDDVPVLEPSISDITSVSELEMLPSVSETPA
jgi:hypothetical protein